MTLTHSTSTDPSNPFSAAEELTPDKPALPGKSERSMSSLELVIRWGDTIVAARHLTPPRSFTLGDGSWGPANIYRVQDLMPRPPGGDFGPRRPLAKLGPQTTTPPNPVTSSSAIPAAVIQRIVRSNYGHFRACYQDGLRRNPSLEGRVAVNFIISRDGTVYGASSGGSSLPDPAVISCVVSSFGGLTFPAPENGIVTVSYPIMLMAPTV